MKLFNNDCMEIMETMESNSIDSIITDPPYGVNYKNDFYDDNYDYIVPKLSFWYEEWYRILKDGCYLFLFVGVKTIHHWIQEGINAGFTYKNIIATSAYCNGSVMCRNNFSFLFQPILVFSKGKGKPFNEVDFIPTSESWLKDKRNKNPKPFTYQYPNFIRTDWAFATEKRASKNLHPNEKNVKLLKFLVEISTKEKEVVLDCFMGCGSTGLACLNANRNFIGIEINKNYFNICKERLSIKKEE